MNIIRLVTIIHTVINVIQAETKLCEDVNNDAFGRRSPITACCGDEILLSHRNPVF